MPYVAIPTIVAIASTALDQVARSVKGNGPTPGLPGAVPPTQAGTTLTYSTDKEELDNLKVTYVRPDSLQPWCTQTEYDAVGLLLYSDCVLYRVESPHVSTTPALDLKQGFIKDITGTKAPVQIWSPQKVYKVNQLVQHNGQLLLVSKNHVSTTLVADCLSGAFKFVANLYVGQQRSDSDDFAFMGQLTSNAGALCACIRSHPTNRWRDEYWVALQPVLQAVPDPPPQYLASTDLSGLSAVAFDAQAGLVSADCTDMSQCGHVCGVLEQAYPSGYPVSYKTTGLLSNAVWRWIPGKPVFFGQEGRLTQQLPKSAVFSQVVGMAISPTRLTIALQPPIVLAKR
jgi:hypothetical protein